MNLGQKLRLNKHESAKRTHGAVHYVARSKKSEHCAKCKHFIQPSEGGPACTGVQSPIAPAGWCIRFKAMKAYADGGAIAMADGGGLSDADLGITAPVAAAPSAGLSDADLGIGAPNVATDVAKSAGIGAAKGIIGFAGMPGDARETLSHATDYVANKLGVSPETTQNIKDYAYTAAKHVPGIPSAMAEGPTSSDIQHSIESQTGKFYEPKTTAGHYAQTVGEFAPAVLAGPGSIGKKLLTQAVIPGLASEAAGQATEGTAYEPYARIAAAVASPAIISAGKRLVTPLPATATRTDLANSLRNEGVDLTAGQATGNRPLQWAESTFGDMPGSGGRAARTMVNQGEQFTGAILNRVGETANRATPDVIDRAFKRIGGQFDDVATRNNVMADRNLGHSLTTVEQEYNSLVGPSQRAPVVANTIKDIGDLAVQNGGHITGDQYNAITSRLARQARGAKTDPQLQEALYGLRESLDDAMERSLRASGNVADLAALQEARNQYRNLMVVEKAATGAGSNAAEGIISPSALRNAVVQQNRRSYARGQGDFADLARAGEAIMRPLPQSGTAPRQNLQHALTLLGGAAGGAAGGFPGAAAGIVAPAVAGRVLMSRPVQAYLGNQVFPAATQPIYNRSLLNALLASSAAREQPVIPQSKTPQ